MSLSNPQERVEPGFDKGVLGVAKRVDSPQSLKDGPCAGLMSRMVRTGRLNNGGL